MVAGAALSDDLTDAQWLCELEDIGEELGYFSPLGDDHAAVFADRAQDVLFVAFETLPGVRMNSETGLPLAFDVCERRGWSHLTLLAMKDTWFRDRQIYAFVDRMVDTGFFEEFDKVVFYGAGMCGYAAAAFSVAAPGATVIAASPQATLARSLTEWDERFPEMRKCDFTSRYGYAPDMLEAADAAYILYDPDEVEDAMHATLFRGSNIHRYRYRRGRSGAIDSDLRAMGLVSSLAEAAVNGNLTPVPIGAKNARTPPAHSLSSSPARARDARKPALSDRASVSGNPCRSPHSQVSCVSREGRGSVTCRGRPIARTEGVGLIGQSQKPAIPVMYVRCKPSRSYPRAASSPSLIANNSSYRLVGPNAAKKLKSQDKVAMVHPIV